MELSYNAVVIFVDEMARSRAFYEGLLGMRIALDHGPNVLYAGGLSLWEREHAAGIIFEPGDAPTTRTGADNLELYFETDDMEEAYETLRRADVQFLQPLHEEPWAQRTFRIRDPDGHIIEVGEPMKAIIRRQFERGSTPREIAERMGAPMELVLQSIGYPRFC